MKKEVPLEAPLNITSCSSTMSSGLASIDFTQENFDEESREKLKGKMRQLEIKLKKEREFHRAILANYEDEQCGTWRKPGIGCTYTGIN